jgi:hypothetical protein
MSFDLATLVRPLSDFALTVIVYVAFSKALE